MTGERVERRKKFSMHKGRLHWKKSVLLGREKVTRRVQEVHGRGTAKVEGHMGQGVHGAEVIAELVWHYVMGSTCKGADTDGDSAEGNAVGPTLIGIPMSQLQRCFSLQGKNL